MKPKQWFMCERKTKYNEKTAKHKAKLMNKKRPALEQVHAYPCPFCDSFHIGHINNPSTCERSSFQNVRK